jgi:hypothetical protein
MREDDGFDVVALVVEVAGLLTLAVHEMSLLWTMPSTPSSMPMKTP